MQNSFGLEPHQPRRIIRVLDWKMLHHSQTALSSKQAYGTLPFLIHNVGRSPRLA